jgi:voltage-gated potassium channel
MEGKNHAYLVFMLILSVLALVALAVEAVFPLDEGTRAIFNYADTLVCALFFVDFLVMLHRAKDRRRYLLTWGWLDLASSIPMVDFLRWGRAARIMRILRVLRGVRAARVLSVFILERRAESAFLATVLLSIILVVVSAVGVLHFEAGDEGNIKTPEDAVWWAVATITTVGYGDRYPVTSEGRVVAAILMVAGVGLFGTFSGFVAAWFLAPGQAKRENELAVLQRDVNEIKQLLTVKTGAQEAVVNAKPPPRSVSQCPQAGSLHTCTGCESRID